MTYFDILLSADGLLFFSDGDLVEIVESLSMTEPSLFHVKVTLGVPWARQISLAVKPYSEADFEMRGDRSMTGLSAKQ